MKLYCLIASHKKVHNQEAFGYLKQACEARGLEFVPVEADTFDYGQDLGQIIETPSLMYRLGLGPNVALLEALLVRPGVATLYAHPEVLFMRSLPWSSTIRMMQHGFRIIPTIFNIGKEQDAQLAAYAEKLGGFPIILKASGGSHGSSVLRADSLESLRSVVGYVTSDPAARFVLRKYISNATHVRMVVVGDQVADAICYLPAPGDFRTNAVAVPQVEKFGRTPETERYFELAAQAVHSQGLEYGGVDLLLDESGEAFIAEINFPCNFARNQMNTGIDVAGMIVDHLLAKAEQA